MIGTNRIGRRRLELFSAGALKFLAKAGVILIIVSALLTGCGYRFAGSGRLPDGIAEPVNRTGEFRLIAILSNELKSEMIRRQVRLADAADAADGVLTSEIVALNDSTIARRGETTALEKRLTVQVTAKLEKADGAVVWIGKGINANETYAEVSGDDMASSSNRQAAVEALCKRLAEDIYNRLSADF
jgi:outer membrane lipopolysaccharide assembly protein LptE/RlpB